MRSTLPLLLVVGAAVQWYDSGHFLPEEAVCAQARRLAERIGTTPDHPAC